MGDWRSSVVVLLMWSGPGSVPLALSQRLSVHPAGHGVPQGAALGGPAPLIPASDHRAAGLLAPGRHDHPAVAVRAFRQELVFPVAAVQEGSEAAVSFGQQSPGAGWA